MLAAFTGALDEWRVLQSASLVGLAQRALELTLDYVKGRRAFGVPIGSFQAVAHGLADMATAISGARYLCHKAAWAADELLPSSHLLALMSMAFSSATVKSAADRCLHFHGGFGYIRESDIQMYFRRALTWPSVIGDMRLNYQAIAECLLADERR